MKRAAEYLIEPIELSAPLFRLMKPLAAQPYSVLLDSAYPSKRLGRYSFLAVDPFMVFTSTGRQIRLSHPQEGREEIFPGDPFEVLRDLMARHPMRPNRNCAPFLGGAVGYFSYDLGRLIEHIPMLADDDLGLPECIMAFYDLVVIHDHHSGRSWLSASGAPAGGAQRTRRSRRRLEQMRRLLANAAAQEDLLIDDSTASLSATDTEPSVNFTREQFLAAVARTIEYIKAGDIFQANISQRFAGLMPECPYDCYLRLRSLNPAPFANFMHFPPVTVLGSSMERFLKVEADRVETRPIKGTCPRGATPEDDRRLARALLDSAKDRAELAMIIDLERNDLGRVCRFGTVRVIEPLVREEYATVHHLVATVEGQLEAGKDRFNLLHATFPGGSISGAPKVRAMEIIEELEPTRRAIYTGCSGYLDFNGDMDLSIVIRTVLQVGGRAFLQLGGGIVADSRPELEYQETIDKGRAIFRALGLASPTRKD